LSFQENDMTTLANKLKAATLALGLAAVPALADQPSYSHVVLTQISDHVAYPHSALIREQEGVVTLSLTVDRSGNVADLKLLNSSGIAAIDKAALQAALAAAPYPQPAGVLAEVKGKLRFAL
jgi:protein TonB